MPAKIIIRNNGPIRIEGEFTIVDQDGRDGAVDTP